MVLLDRTYFIKECHIFHYKIFKAQNNVWNFSPTRKGSIDQFEFSYKLQTKDTLSCVVELLLHFKMHAFSFSPLRTQIFMETKCSWHRYVSKKRKNLPINMCWAKKSNSITWVKRDISINLSQENCKHLDLNLL